MRRYARILFLPAFLLGCLATPSAARVHVGVYLGPGWWGAPYDPFWYDPYWYDPYWYGSYGYPYSPYYPPYVYEQVEREPAKIPRKPDTSRHDLTFIEGQIARAQEEAEFNYDDGDVTKEQYKAELHRLSKIREEARAQAKANGGYITGDQEKDFLKAIRGEPLMARPASESAPATTPDVNVMAVTDRIARLRDLLDQKVASGDITKAQRRGLADYLDRTEKQVKSQAASHDGTLTADQEEAVMQQLRRVEDSISENLIPR